jgi:hypothetical protein
MASNINPNNINGAYPVAGQDNNSQGFRDNFTNTSTNFQFAANEITDLQNKVIVSAQLTGGNVLTTQNNMLNSPLINALISDFAATTVSLGVLSGSVPINYAAGHYQTVTTGAPISLSFTNFPIAGQLGIITVQITVANTAHTVTFPSAVSVNTTGIVGLNTSTNVITFAATGVFSFTFTTSNGGSTITITETNKQLQPYNNSSEWVGSGAAANLAVTTTFFSAGGTATLANGVTGQIKILSQTIAGSMVVTVSNAGWKTSGTGTVTLGSIGTSVTLQYGVYNGNDYDWFCIGNNGATFG